jgi:plastocyanin
VANAGARILWAGLACTLALCLLPATSGDPVSSSAALQSPPLGPGAVFSTTLPAGSYPYHCHPHPFMMGTVTVLPTPAAGGPRTYRIDIVDDGNATHAAAMGFRDAATAGNATTVHAGDTLVWVNTGRLYHDVHLVSLASASGGDLGAFEVWVLAGLAAALAGIYVLSRRV